jgi:hypothetical protein
MGNDNLPDEKSQQVEKSEQKETDEATANSLEDTSQDKALEDSECSWIVGEEAKEIAKENIGVALDLVKNKAVVLAESGWLAVAQAAKKTKTLLSESEAAEKPEPQDTGGAPAYRHCLNKAYKPRF